MKLASVLAITITLINKKCIQIKELAELFEVSVSTVYRDIKALKTDDCKIRLPMIN